MQSPQNAFMTALTKVLNMSNVAHATFIQASAYDSPWNTGVGVVISQPQKRRAHSFMSGAQSDGDLEELGSAQTRS